MASQNNDHVLDRRLYYPGQGKTTEDELVSRYGRSLRTKLANMSLSDDGHLGTESFVFESLLPWMSM